MQDSLAFRTHLLQLHYSPLCLDLVVTFDLSGLKQITIENDDDDTSDTIEEIKSGDVVVIGVGKDGNVTSLTVKALNGRFGNRDRNRNNGNGNGNGSRKNRENGNGRSEKGDSADA